MELERDCWACKSNGEYAIGERHLHKQTFRILNVAHMGTCTDNSAVRDRRGVYPIRGHLVEQLHGFIHFSGFGKLENSVVV